MIAHDMRTPLNALSLSLQAFRAARSNPDMQDEALRIAERNIRALGGMIESLLTASADGPWARGPLNLRKCNAGEIIASAIDQVAPLASEKAQKIQAAPSASLPPLAADSERLTRVLVNLLSNSVKFSPEGSTIAIETWLRNNDGHPVVVFSVIDQGVGVSPEDIPRIFQHGVSIAKAGRYSSGLGLAVCKEIVEAHDGRIWVEPEHASGATFSFSIPVSLSGE